VTSDETQPEEQPTGGDSPAEQPPIEQPPIEAPPVDAPPVERPTSLVYLDVDDEITSAAARIRAATASRVVLVLPYGSRLATSRINFRLLAHDAAARDKQVEIICADASARALAASAGLPVHASVAAFEGRAPSPTGGAAGAGGDHAGAAGTAAEAAGAGVIPEPGPDDADDTQTRVLPIPRRSSPKVPIVGPPRPPIRTGFAVGGVVAIVLLLLVGGWLALELLPSATIVLHPRSQDLGPIELTVEARTDVTAPDATALVIPARQLTFDVQASDTFPATGVKTIETKATGNVTFSNFDTGRANQIDAGSIVKTPSGLEFVTLATVTLPNATIEFPFTIVPSTSSVGVEAVVAGPEGNVDNNTITVVPKGENRRLLQVTNKEATSGGERSEAPEVSQQDVDTAKAAIEAALVAQLDQDVAAGTGVPAGVTLFPETRAVGDTVYAVDPATLVGTAATQFDLSATAQGTALGVDPAPLNGIAETRLRTRVTAGWTLVPDSITPLVGTPSVVGDVISFPMTVAGTQVHDVDAVALVASIKGLVLAEARSKLDDYGDVEVTLWPDWVSTIPKRVDRITLTLGEPQPSASPAP
jgi:hypothetical protein